MILTRDGKEITAIYSQDGSEVEDLKDANGRLVYLASREITGTLPLPFSGRGKPLTDYLISGNTVQDGTPSSVAPVDVVGCGVRTGNLFDKNTVKNGYYISDANGSLKYGGTALNASDYIYIGGASNVHIESQQLSHQWGAYYDSTKTFVSGFTGYGNKPIPINAAYVRITVHSEYLDSMMLNLGSTALSYEPYGYKLPPTVNGTEYPIYLGEVESTRRVKKLVLTGEENWFGSAKYRMGLLGQIGTVRPFCTHYIGATYAEYAYIRNGQISVNGENARTLVIYDVTNQTSIADWKSYLAAQYAAGTPVTVWYVLAEPETAVVNEPLMKIGDYADTISFAQAEVVIPTVSGANVLDMTSPVKPSEVYIKGKGIKQNGG